jgi:hypothetical protein
MITSDFQNNWEIDENKANNLTILMEKFKAHWFFNLVFFFFLEPNLFIVAIIVHDSFTPQFNTIP